RCFVAHNTDVPLAGGCVFHSQYVTRSEAPSLTVCRDDGHDPLKDDNELSRGRRVKLASLQVVRAPAGIEPGQDRAGSWICLGKDRRRGWYPIDLGGLDGNGLEVRLIIRGAIQAGISETRRIV